MRWLVEVSPVGKQETQTYCVDADSWQKALEYARKMRGEVTGISGFSIELLEAGYRAVDPLARLRFVVKHAPPGAALTEGAPQPSLAPGGADSAAMMPDIPSDANTLPNLAAAAPVDESSPAITSKDGGNDGKEVPPAAGSSPGSKKAPPRAGIQMKKPVQRQVRIGASGAAAEDVSVRGVDTRLDPKTDPAPPMPEASDPSLEIEIIRSEPPAKLAATLAQVNAPPSSAAPASAPPPSSDVVMEVTRSDPPPANGLPAVGSPLPGLPQAEVLIAREQEPDSKSPIVYREYAFAVPQGTSDANAERVLVGQLEIVKRHIAHYTSRKFVNLAVFDVKFTGKPPAPPLVTLTWKDWAGAPVVGFPRQGKKPSIVPPKKQSVPPPAANKRPSQPPIPVAAPVPVFQAPAAPPVPNFQQPSPPRHGELSPQSTTAPMQQAPQQQPPPQQPQPVAQQQQMAPQQMAPQPIPSHVPQQPTMPPSHQMPPQQMASATPQMQPPMHSQQPVAPHFPSQQPQYPSHQPQYASQQPQQYAPQQAPPYLSQQPQQQQPQQPQYSRPVPAQSHAPQADPFAQPAPQQPQQPAPQPAQRPASVPPPRSSNLRIHTPGAIRPSSTKLVAAGRGRVAGDELISALFEAMHDLHFLRDALEGGDFCLALANEMIPSRAGFVHVYDVNKRDFVVACSTGAGADAILGRRIADSDALLLSAMKKRKSVVIPDAANGDAAGLERYRLLGGSKSVIVTPVMFGARALASIELINPNDGAPFTEDEGHAMNYIAEQFAEFIGSHGLVLETDKILAHRAAQPHA